jgi:membrane-associated protein
MNVAPMLLGIKWMDPNWLLGQFGAEFFWVCLAIVFVECGLLFPFLPGDTLLFAVGLFVATDKIHVFPGGQGVALLLSLVLMMAAAFAGNIAGYEIGRQVGEPMRNHDGRVLKRKHLDKTAEFFDKHGNMALVLGRFVPFIRTYITLVAGVTRMDRRRFALWSLVGAVLWVAIVMLAGYFLGAAFPSLGENIDKAMLVILAFSVIPVAIEWWRKRRTRSTAVHTGGSAPADASSDTAHAGTAAEAPLANPDAPLDVDRA